MTVPVITWEIVARQGEDGHDGGFARVHLHKSYGGYTRTELNRVVDQLHEVIRRMTPEAENKERSDI